MDCTSNKAVLRELNETNASLLLARVFADGSSLVVEGCLPVEPLQARDLALLCQEVGSTADRLGSLLSAVHGGQQAFPVAHDPDPDHECED